MLILEKDEKYLNNKYMDFYFMNTHCGKFRISREKNCTSIWGVIIFPDFRGKGLGKQMMKECLDFIVNLYPEFTKTILFVRDDNYAALKVYESVGFKVSANFKRYGPAVQCMEYCYG